MAWRKAHAPRLLLDGMAIKPMGGLHDRMPVILNADEQSAWLGSSDDVETFGAGAMLAHHSVSPFGLRDDGPELIEALEGQ